MSAPDHLYRFVFEHANIRGEIVHLDEAFQAVTVRREYPPVLRGLIGQAMAAVALLASTIKFRGSLTLQVQGQEGPLSLLVVQAGSDGGLRALARWKGDEPEGATLGELCPDGYLAITIDPEGGERYQGVVGLNGGDLAQALDTYFRESEQLATRVWLTADASRAAGLLIQRLPGADADADADADAWNRAEILAGTVTAPELLQLSAPELIRRLYNEEDIRLFDPLPFRFKCTCSRERIGEVLRSLGQDEVHDIVAEQGQVEVHCDFCNEGYVFDAVDVERLFVAGESEPAPETRH